MAEAVVEAEDLSLVEAVVGYCLRAVVAVVSHPKAAEGAEECPLCVDGRSDVVMMFSRCRRKGCLEHVKLALGPSSTWEPQTSLLYLTVQARCYVMFRILTPTHVEVHLEVLGG
jgi:hypothetical protein